MYPQIIIEQKGSDFVVHEHPTADESTWDIHYQGPDQAAVVDAVCRLLWNDGNAFLTVQKGCEIKGYLFQIRGPENTKRFFRTANQVHNPFRNRKMYAEQNKTSTVSFHPIGFD